jgi:hypothetical protein
MMMTKKQYFLLLGVIYISLMVGIAMGTVGQEYEGGIHSWYTPILVLLVTGLPFMIGYNVGKETKQ